jgi:hypothetical protein
MIAVSSEVVIAAKVIAMKRNLTPSILTMNARRGGPDSALGAGLGTALQPTGWKFVFRSLHLLGTPPESRERSGEAELTLCNFIRFASVFFL